MLGEATRLGSWEAEEPHARCPFHLGLMRLSLLRDDKDRAWGHPQVVPCLVESPVIDAEAVVQVACGNRHTVVRTGEGGMGDGMK